MKSITISEAKTHLPRLIDDLFKSNESVKITRHGVTVARILPEKAFEGERIADVISHIKKIRKGTRLNGLTIRQLRAEGRR